MHTHTHTGMKLYMSIVMPECVFVRLQRGKRHTVENGSGAEDNGDSSHCSNASVHSNQVIHGAFCQCTVYAFLNQLLIFILKYTSMCF